VATFGLGDATVVDRVTVVWPYDFHPAYHTQTLVNLAVDATVVIVENDDDGVDVESGSDLPTAFKLHPCYPNPFNPITTLRYDVPRSGSVQLTIYDLAGRRIRSLVGDSSHPAGRHAAIWNGRDDQGRTVAAGLYYCRLETPEFSETRGVTLIK
jgi:hypothetical protein